MKNRRALKIFLIIILSFLLLLLSFVIWQFPNIKAFYESRVYSKEELMQKVSSSKEKIQKEIETKYPNIVVQDISAEDELDLLKGKISISEISQKYNIPMESDSDEKTSSSTKEGTVNKPKTSDNKTNTTESKPIDNGKMTNEDKVISNHIGQMYGIKAKYLSKLGQLERDAISEYKNSNGSVSKQDIGYKYAGIGGSYESACDSEVEFVLKSLENELSSMNADTSIINSLRSSYYEEKQAKKAYYLSMFQ